MMRHVHATALMGACALFMASLSVASTATAQRAGGGPKQAAEAAFQRALVAQKANRHPSAVRDLTAAINSGVLPPSKLAQALMYRGISYRRNGQPAQAISDFNSIEGLKVALSGSDRSRISSERARAYKDAGVKAVAVPAAKLVAKPVAEARPVKVVRPPLTQPILGSPVQTAATTPVRAQPRRLPATSNSWQTATKPAPVTRAPTMRQQASTETANANPIGDFFSNLFGGGDGAGAKAAATQTGSIRKAPTGSTGWSPQTERRPAEAVRKAAVQPTRRLDTASAPARQVPSDVRKQKSEQRATPAKRVAKASPKLFDLQVAKVRSRERAEALVKQIRVEFGSDLAGHQPWYQEGVVGNMGMFYSVKIGAYRTSSLPTSLCRCSQRPWAGLPDAATLSWVKSAIEFSVQCIIVSS